MKLVKSLGIIALASSLLLTTAGCASDANAADPTPTVASTSDTVLPILDAWQLVASKSMSQMLDTGVVETYNYANGASYTYVFDASADADNPAGMLQQPGDNYNVVPESTYFLVVQAGDFVTPNFTIDYEGEPQPNNFIVRVANLQQTEPAMYIQVVDGLIVAATGGEGDSAYSGTIKYELTDADRQIVTTALAQQ